MIFNSAGHVLGGRFKDPGASANGYVEATLTAEFRNLINVELRIIGAKYISDGDVESLAQYLNRIQTGSGSVIHETHFNSSTNATATGVEVLIPARYTSAEFNCAREIAQVIATTYGIPLRGDKGVRTELDSARGTLGIMRKDGMNILTEVCFITNTTDMAKHTANKQVAAKAIAAILKKYDAMFE